jgi:hypothetical protein
VRELQSSVDFGRFDPAIDPVFRALSSNYWSSTSYADVSFTAWFVLFYNSVVDDFDEDLDNHVRAVRNTP